jgi:hypothetical protein
LQQAEMVDHVKRVGVSLDMRQAVADADTNSAPVAEDTPCEGPAHGRPAPAVARIVAIDGALARNEQIVDLIRHAAGMMIARGSPAGEFNAPCIVNLTNNRRDPRCDNATSWARISSY